MKSMITEFEEKKMFYLYLLFCKIKIIECKKFSMTSNGNISYVYVQRKQTYIFWKINTYRNNDLSYIQAKKQLDWHTHYKPRVHYG